MSDEIKAVDRLLLTFQVAGIPATAWAQIHAAANAVQAELTRLQEEVKATKAEAQAACSTWKTAYDDLQQRYAAVVLPATATFPGGKADAALERLAAQGQQS